MKKLKLLITFTGIFFFGILSCNGDESIEEELFEQTEDPDPTDPSDPEEDYRNEFLGIFKGSLRVTYIDLVDNPDYPYDGEIDITNYENVNFSVDLSMPEYQGHEVLDNNHKLFISNDVLYPSVGPCPYMNDYIIFKGALIAPTVSENGILSYSEMEECYFEYFISEGSERNTIGPNLPLYSFISQDSLVYAYGQNGTPGFGGEEIITYTIKAKRVN